MEEEMRRTQRVETKGLFLFLPRVFLQPVPAKFHYRDCVFGPTGDLPEEMLRNCGKVYFYPGESWTREWDGNDDDDDDDDLRRPSQGMKNTHEGRRLVSSLSSRREDVHASSGSFGCYVIFEDAARNDHVCVKLYVSSQVWSSASMQMVL